MDHKEQATTAVLATFAVSFDRALLIHVPKNCVVVTSRGRNTDLGMIPISVS